MLQRRFAESRLCRRAQQDAFVGALWLGDLADASVSQRLWIDSAEDAHYLDCKRAHIADAIAHWRAFLGVDTAGVEGVETAPVVAESDDIPDPDVEPDPDDPPPDRPSRGELKPGNPRDMRSTFRFRV